MKNRFYTLLVIPEKTSKIRRFLLPGWIVKGVTLSFFIVGVLVFIMFVDYWKVIDKIGENKELRLENRKLIQQVQIFKNKVSSIEDTIERIETFATRLKVITNIEDKDQLVKRLNEKPLPIADNNIGDIEEESIVNKITSDIESLEFEEERVKINKDLKKINTSSLLLEQNLHDIYELLMDQKSFISALPTIKPCRGYFTSGFGIRESPHGGGTKMHEGLDIANRSGTSIRSTANGFVRFSGIKPGYGKTIIVDHGYGLETWYAHLKDLKVKQGVQVRRGSLIALMGSTGRSTGSHVHYEVRVHGIPVDPLSYILYN